MNKTRRTQTYVILIVPVREGSVRPIGSFISLFLTVQVLADVASAKLVVEHAEQVGLELAKTAATAALSAGVNAAGSAVGNIAGKAMEGAGKFANFAAQAGISAVTSYAASVGTSFVNNWNFDEEGKLKFDAESFGKSTYSAQTIAGAVGAGITSGLNEISVGARTEKVMNSKTGKMENKVTYTRANGLSSTQISSIQALNGLAGGLVSNTMEYAVDGQTTFNLLNSSMFGHGNVGFLELTVGKDGISSRFGMGGTNISINNLINSVNGAKVWDKSKKINDFVEGNNLSSEAKKKLADALRMQYGFGNKDQLANLDDILGGKTNLGDTDTDGKAQTVAGPNDTKTIMLAMSEGMDWKELGLLIGHEAYRDGIVSDNKFQKDETRKAVKGHTDMASRMLGDVLYASSMAQLINNNQNLQMDLLARALGNDVFNAYVDGTYDSSADYWKLNRDGTLSYDGSGNLYDENRNLILDTGKGIQGGLQKILNISEEEAYQLLKNSKFNIDKTKIACWDLTSNEGKTIDFNNKLDSGKTYEELYKTSVITDSLTGYTATLEHQNPFVMYQDLINSGIGPYTYDSSADGEWNGRLPVRQLSYEEWKDNNYITEPSLNMISLEASVNGKTSSECGIRIDPFSGKKVFHGGTDTSVPVNTAFYSMGNGKVYNYYYDKDGGNTLIVKHLNEYQYKGNFIESEYYTSYMHLNSVNVTVGQKVNVGQKLGLTGNTGKKTTNPHLDSRIFFNSITTNPYANWLNQKGYVQKYQYQNYYANQKEFIR